MKTRDDFYLCSNAVIRFEACYLGNECLILDISCVLLKIDRQFQFVFQCLHKGKYTPIVNINQVFEKTFGLNILSKSTPVNCNSNTKYTEVNCNIFILEKKGFFAIKCLGNLGYIFSLDLKHKTC